MHVGGESRHVGGAGRDGAEQIPPQGVAERPVARGERRLVGPRTTVKRPGHRLDPSTDAEVANPHLAQRPIHVVHHHVEKRLSQRAALLSLPVQAAQH